MGKTYKKNDYHTQKYSKFVPKDKFKDKHKKNKFNGNKPQEDVDVGNE